MLILLFMKLADISNPRVALHPHCDGFVRRDRSLCQDGRRTSQELGRNDGQSFGQAGDGGTRSGAEDSAHYASRLGGVWIQGEVSRLDCRCTATARLAHTETCRRRVQLHAISNRRRDDFSRRCQPRSEEGLVAYVAGVRARRRKRCQTEVKLIFST